jgi:hypothetical protein
VIEEEAVKVKSNIRVQKMHRNPKCTEDLIESNSFLPLFRYAEMKRSRGILVELT